MRRLNPNLNAHFFRSSSSNLKLYEATRRDSWVWQTDGRTEGQTLPWQMPASLSWLIQLSSSTTPGHRPWIWSDRFSKLERGCLPPSPSDHYVPPPVHHPRCVPVSWRMKKQPSQLYWEEVANDTRLYAEVWLASVSATCLSPTIGIARGVKGVHLMHPRARVPARQICSLTRIMRMKCTRIFLDEFSARGLNPLRRFPI